MLELSKHSTIDHILEVCREEFKDHPTPIRMSDVFNTVFRNRGDDLEAVFRMVEESVGIY